MKKSESVFKGVTGCGITSPFAAFPRLLFGLRSLILPEKFTWKWGEGTILALEAPVEITFNRKKKVKFDITIIKKGEKHE